MLFHSINPHTQAVLATYESLSAAGIQRSLALAEHAYSHWRFTSFATRRTCMERLVGLLHAQKEPLAQLVTAEMGKILREARAEVDKSAAHCAWCAEQIEMLVQPQTIPTEIGVSKVVFDPLGAVFGIMPWNYPLWQVLRYAAPTIMAGNVTILKHAPNVFGCAKALERLFLEAGFPEGVFQSVLIDATAAEAFIAADIVQGITLTGSEYAGSQVAALAGKHIKKTVLELGGSDAFIVLDDADLDVAVRTAVTARFMNAGQACICAKRFLIVDSVYEAFAARFQQAIAALRTGDPTDPATDLGPMARLDLAEKVTNQRDKSVANGAQPLLLGTQVGCHVSPTLLGAVPSDSAAFVQETFGPLAALVRVPDAATAVAVANQHRYGLAASLWTGNLAAAEYWAHRLDVGSVFVNGMVRSDSRLPFGGIKKSGYGRELAELGVKEFLNAKTVVIQCT